MRNVLQAIVDTFVLAAGSAELGSTAYSPNNSARDMHRHAAAKPLPERALPVRLASRPDPQPFTGEATLRTSAEKIRP